MSWKHPARGKVEFFDVMEFIREKILNDGGNNNFDIIIGTDSQAQEGNTKTRYVSAIIFHTIGKGGTFWVNREEEPFAKSLRNKIWHETMLTHKHATTFRDKMEDILALPNVHFHVHVDCGENGPTKELIKEVTGFFVGEGFEVQTKPYSFAASTVADKYSK